MNRTRSYLAAAGLLLLGAALALVIEHAVLLHARRPHSLAQATHAELMKLMDSELNLSPAQQDSVHAILQRHQAAVDSAWRSINRAVGATMDTVHRELQTVLDSAQQAQFRQWLRQQHRMHR